MRRFFFILLAANALLLAWVQFGAGNRGESTAGHEPFHAEDIKVLDESQLARLPAAKPAPPAPKPAACLQWGEFSGAELTRAAKALEDLQLGDKVSRQKVEKAQGWWVYIPPRKTLQEAQKKVTELKQLGVEESFVIQDGARWRYAVSLGVFSSEEGAKKFLAQMKDKGVKSANAGPRIHETDGARLLIRDVSEETTAQIVKLKSDFAGSELKAVECKPAANGGGQ